MKGKIYIAFFVCAIIALHTNITIAQTSIESLYNFNAPVNKVTLPDVLKEISGMTFVDDNTLACIQDENGKIYFYNLLKKTITRTHTFAKEGDFEGIAYANGFLYVLRSDGVLFEIPDSQSPTKTEISYTLNVPSKNCEGLCYDKKNNRLLIASKGKPDNLNKEDAKRYRYIYCFDLANKTLCSNSFYTIDLKEIESYIKKHGIEFHYTKTNKDGEEEEKKPKVRASELAVHPLSGDIYIESAVEHVMYRFSPSGNFVDLAILSEDVHPQPEGISFTKNGDVYISNEANGGLPTLMLFEIK
nr:SdiA-regulated domain-containing protein [uncultured Carboxylicivirga sp.]